VPPTANPRAASLAPLVAITWGVSQGIDDRDGSQFSLRSPAGQSPSHQGLLRQYFPKGTDLSLHSPTDLDWVATELNDRPRKRLGFAKPIEEIGPLLLR
jgi:hypothetical protein